ncbi:MAG: UDP-glucose dehydrogenase family protein, partial [Nannocystaceae bacterium]
DAAAAIAEAEAIFVCVGTPPAEDGGPDMRYVYGVVEDIARAMTTPKLVVMKSTVPVGTAREVRARMEAITEVSFEVISNPEFLKEGAALQDFQKPDRVVIGASSDAAAAPIRDLYAPFMRKRDRVLVMDNTSAELTKYGSNALLATRISFMNELANFADRAGADIAQVRLGMGCDSRIGPSFLFPGVGYGGSCFPKDVDALVYSAKQLGMDLQMLAATNAVNRRQKEVMFDKVVTRLGSDLRGKTIALWGLSFKPNTDDIREAPALTLIRKFLEAGASIRAFDPEAMDNARVELGDAVQLVERQYDALDGADALIIVTEWSQFRQVDWEELDARMRGRLLFDGRNVLSPEACESRGYEYYGIGRGRPTAVTS